MNLRKDHSHKCHGIHVKPVVRRHASFVVLAFLRGPRPPAQWRIRVYPLTHVPLVPPAGAFACSTSTIFGDFHLKLSAMDVSARAALKGAAKCDRHCELQNSVNRQEPERILFFWDIPESMPTSVSVRHCPRRSSTRVTTVSFMP